MLYYYIKIPRLPPELSHQTRSVQLVQYAATERQSIAVGDVLAVIENGWARMALKAVSRGVLSKTFFDSGTYITEGSPLAIMICDGEEGSPNAAGCELIVLEHLRAKRA